MQLQKHWISSDLALTEQEIAMIQLVTRLVPAGSIKLNGEIFLGSNARH
jgi:hypothetical protein